LYKAFVRFGTLRHPEIIDELTIEGFSWGFLLQLQVQRKEIGLEIGAIAFIASQWYGCDMKREIWINKAKSFEDAQEFDTAYYLNLLSAERVETVQVLREAYFKSNGLFRRENGKRLRRVLRVIKQA
jgi:hypothetical protein